MYESGIGIPWQLVGDHSSECDKCFSLSLQLATCLMGGREGGREGSVPVGVVSLTTHRVQPSILLTWHRSVVITHTVIHDIIMTDDLRGVLVLGEEDTHCS